MGDQARQGQPPAAQQRLNGQHVRPLPLGSSTDSRFPHEGGSETEGKRLVVEPRQDDFTTRSEAADQGVQQAGVAADVVDGLVVTAGIRFGIDHPVPDRTFATLRVQLPDGGRWFSRCDGQTCQEPPQDPVADDQIGSLMGLSSTASSDRVIRRGGQCQQHGLLGSSSVSGNTRAAGTTTLDAEPPKSPRTPDP